MSVFKPSRGALWLAFVSAANLGAGVALQFAGAFLLGAGAEMDAYFAAQTVPLIASTIVSTGLVNNLVPLLVGIGQARTPAFLRAVALRLLLPLCIGFAALAISARWWVPVFFSGAGGPTQSLIVELSPLMCGIFAFNVLASVGISGYYARGDFVRIEALQLGVAAVAICVSAPIARHSGVLGFTVLLLARALVSCLLFALPFIRARGEVRDGELGKLWTSMRQIMSGSVVFKFGPLVDRMIASWAAPGVITSLGIGQQVIGFSTAISERVLTRPLLVAASTNLAGSSDRLSVLEKYRQQLGAVLMAAVAGAVLVSILAALMLSGGFEPELLRSRALGRLDVVVLTALVAIPAAAGQLSAALMYALGEVKAISRYAIFTFLGTSAIKFFGFFFFGVYAIIAGMFIYQAANWVLMHMSAIRALDPTRSNDFYGPQNNS
jgi:hypothetical protein